jgi:hydroxyethylthiazole kinase-like uncharacterized protein yjeF
MTELLTAAQMRAIEAAAIASGEVTGLELMERAGRGVVEAIFEKWPELRATTHRAVVLCGPGNNGGDGFVVARLLQEWGWEVEVFLYGDPERLPPDARVNYERWVGAGRLRHLDELDWSDLKGATLAVDALFGIGLSRPVPPGAWGALVMAQESHLRLVAIDILSGICADSGRVVSDTGYTDVPADLTVTFERAKRGHVLDAGARLSGRLRVIPIGLDAAMDGLLRRGDTNEIADSASVAGGLLGKESGDHKYAHGHALILSGPSGRGGAARLAARGALRIGAGLVTVGCPLDAIPENAARLDAVMLRGVADADALVGVLEDQRINTLCLGPGLETGEREAGLVAVALGSRGKPRLVLDADALTILAQHPDLFAALHEGCVLTPHAGEFGRLFPDIAEKLAAPATKGPAYSKVDATREAAARAGCVVLYKGPDTVIAAPSGRAAINSANYDRAAPWLATAGSGDVLAGFITGLLARGFSPFDAACTGAWLHVECARSFGPGLIAEDLPEELPKVFRALGL